MFNSITRVILGLAIATTLTAVQSLAAGPEQANIEVEKFRACQSEIKKVKDAIECAITEAIEQEKDYPSALEGLDFSCVKDGTNYKKDANHTRAQSAINGADAEFKRFYRLCTSGRISKLRDEKKEREQKDEKTRERFDKDCDDANDTFKDEYKAYRKACQEAGISNCSANIGSCIEAVNGYGDDGYEAFSNARTQVGTEEANCPALSAEGFGNLKEAYKAAQNSSSDLSKDIGDYEDQTTAITEEATNSISEMEQQLRQLQVELSQADARIEVIYKQKQNEALQPLIEQQKAIEEILNQQIELRQTMMDRRIDLDVGYQEQIGQCVESAKQSALQSFQQLYADRSRRSAGAGNEGGIGRSSAVSASSLFSGGGQSSQQRLKTEYQKQLAICLNGGGLSVAKSAYLKRVSNLEEDYQAQFQLLNEKRIQAERDYQVLKQTLANQLEGEALSLIQEKERLLVAIAELNNALSTQQSQVSSMLSQRNAQLAQMRLSQAQSQYQYQMMEQQYLAKEAITGGKEVEPGAVYAAIEAYYGAEKASEDMLRTCNCTNCFSESYSTLRSGEALSASCNSTGLAFIKRISEDSEEIICPSGDFEPNEALNRNHGGSGSGSSGR